MGVVVQKLGQEKEGGEVQRWEREPCVWIIRQDMNENSRVLPTDTNQFCPYSLTECKQNKKASS